MAIAFVQAYTGVQFGNSTGGTTGAKTLTAGNFLGIASTGSVSTWTTTTTPSGTVAQANPATVNAQDYARLQYEENVAGGSTTVTLAIAAASYSSLCCGEWSGVATSSSLDQHNITTGSGALLTSPSVTTTQNDELLLGHGTTNIAGNGNAWTAGTSYTVRSSTTDDNNGAVDFIEDRIVSSTGSYNATCTKTGGSGTWVCGIGTFKAAGGGAVVLPSVPTMPTRLAP